MANSFRLKSTLIEVQPYITFLLLSTFWIILNKLLFALVEAIKRTMIFAGGNFEIISAKFFDRLPLFVFGFIIIFYFTILRHYYQKIVGRA